MPRRETAVAILASLLVGLSACSREPAESTQIGQTPVPVEVDRSSDEWAGKEADLDKIGHSPKDGSPYLGPEKAPVVVNVFTDFQCPVCRRSADPIKQLVLDRPDKVKVVFRNNALPTHARSHAAALAARAAGRQGRFWPFYDRLFADPSALDEAGLKQTASDLGLDVDQWQRDMVDPKNAEKIEQESAAAVRLGVPGTPGIFVNGIRSTGWSAYRNLRWDVDKEIAEGEALAKAGTSLTDIPAVRIRATADRNPKSPGEGQVNADEWAKVLLAD